MTRGTHLRVLLPKTRGVDIGAVRIEAPASQRRVTREAVTLRVTRYATLKILSCRLAMTQGKELLGVVVPGLERSGGDHPSVHMTTGTELIGIVAIGALGLLVVG